MSIREARLGIGLGIALSLLIAACSTTRPVETVLPQVWHEQEQADTLVVMLPGARDGLDDFVDRGVLELFQRHRPDWSIVAVDAHMGYYRNRSFLERLNEDVIEPARARGYRRFWLTGPSLGGFGSLLFACLGGAEDVVGVIAVAPYLGGRAIIEDIHNAGGVAGWAAGQAGQAHEKDLWSCLGNQPDFDLWLAWGSDDRFDRANRLLAATLSDERIVVQPGGHDWRVWKSLWDEVLRSAP